MAPDVPRSRFLSRSLAAACAAALGACGSRGPATAPQVLVGPDQTIQLAESAHFTLSLPSGLPNVFWSKISGPGVVSFPTEQFNSSFEDGTVNAWLADNGGDETGGGSVTSDFTHSGTYSWMAYNNPQLPDPYDFSAKLDRWRFDDDSAYYSAWYYWPADYLVNGQGSGATRNYVNIFQYKERTSPWDPVWIIAVEGVPGTTDQDEFYVHAWNYLELPTGVHVPKGRWFQITVFLREGWTDGRLALWIDGQPVFDRSDLNTLGGATNTNPPHVMWGVGNYGTPGIGKQIYVDDAVVVPAGLAPAQTAAFSAAGVYVLRLTASDGSRVVSDDVTVTVR